MTASVAELTSDTLHIDPRRHPSHDRVPRFLLPLHQSFETAAKSIPIGVWIGHTVHFTPPEQNSAKIPELVLVERLFVQEIKEFAVKAHLAQAMYGKSVVQPLVVLVNFFRFSNEVINHFETIDVSSARLGKCS
jgi:hypothetical protein